MCIYKSIPICTMTCSEFDQINKCQMYSFHCKLLSGKKEKEKFGEQIFDLGLSTVRDAEFIRFDFMNLCLFVILFSFY